MTFLVNASSYREWRAAKLANAAGSIDELIVEINSLTALDDSSKARILASCGRSNMAIYMCRDEPATSASICALAAQFGLLRLDHHLCANENGVAELTLAADGPRTGYVPYSNRSLSWHTDGYYNENACQIRAVVLHCAQDAADGGESAILDPEIAYIRMRDADPRFIDAFEHPECMTIPANVGAQGEIRPAASGPVFSYDPASKAVFMRYSARRKNIRWRDDALTHAARFFLTDLLADETGPALRHRLQPGQGLISNNVLHNRTAFTDSATHKRLLYRARFFDRVVSS
jgi:alpha-ketoglutarate-dependent taurine dioxygenase